MNNVEQFYKDKKVLERVERQTHYNNTFFFRVGHSENGIGINFEEDFIKGLEKNECGNIKYMIQTWVQDRRKEIETYVVECLKEDLGKSKIRVLEDLGLDIPSEIADPRD